MKPFELRTETDLRMSVQIVECTNSNLPDVFKTKEIGFIIHGYDPTLDEEVEHVVTISKSESLRLITELLRIGTEI